MVDHGNLVRSTAARAVRVRRILAADEVLCSSKRSRNNEFGHYIGGGCPPEDAQHIVEGKHGVIEGIGNVRFLASHLGERLMEVPYLHNTSLVLEGRRTVAQAMEDLQERRDNWL